MKALESSALSVRPGGADGDPRRQGLRRRRTARRSASTRRARTGLRAQAAASPRSTARSAMHRRRSTTALGAAARALRRRPPRAGGRDQLGSLLLVMAYLAQLYGPLQTISNAGRRPAGASLASAERAFSLLDEAPDVAERPSAAPLARARGAIELRRRLASPTTPTSPSCASVSFAVAPGDAGRASRARPAPARRRWSSLLTRFYDPTAGAILLDGVDLRDYRARRPAQPVRDRAAGAGAVLDEHRARTSPTPGRMRRARGDRRGGARRQRARLHRRPARRLRDAASASAACASRAASASASRSPARS